MKVIWVQMWPNLSSFPSFSHRRCESVWAVWEDTGRGGCQAVPERERGVGEAEGGPQKCTDFPAQGEKAVEGGGEERHRSETNHIHSACSVVGFIAVLIMSVWVCVCSGNSVEKQLAELETLCKQKEEERVELELRLTEVKENLKKSLARGALGPPTDTKINVKVGSKHTHLFTAGTEALLRKLLMNVL